MNSLKKDVQFKSYLIKNQIESTNESELREQFFSKPKACFRASPLVKKYGWGVHYDNHGKVSLVDVNSETYNEFFQLEGITKLKGMRSKRK